MSKKKEEIIEDEINLEEGEPAIFLRKVDVVICEDDKEPRIIKAEEDKEPDIINEEDE